MTSSDTPKPNYSRRMMWLALFIIVLFGGYSAAWFYVAGLIEARVPTVLAAVAERGTKADCEKPTARGFPFRIGLYCDRVSFADQRGTSVSAGALRTAAQVYNPFLVRAELDGPATVATVAAQPLALDWSTLSASVRLATPLPERVSLEGSGLKVDAAATNLLQAKTFEGHMRPNGADLDVAGSFAEAVVNATLAPGRTLPTISGNIDATIANGVALARARPKTLRGQAATIRTLTLSTDEKTGLGLSGTIAAAEDGLIDADLTLNVRNARALAEIAAQALPEMRDRIEKAAPALTLMGNDVTLPLKIVRGRATLGFIRLGDIPPV